MTAFKDFLKIQYRLGKVKDEHLEMYNDLPKIKSAKKMDKADIDEVKAFGSAKSQGPG
jgi:hypothetical protein